jgi:2-keto-myo-inositol isomerase
MTEMLRRFALHGATLGGDDLLGDIVAARDAGADAIEIQYSKLQSYFAGGGESAELRDHLRLSGLEPVALTDTPGSVPLVGTRSAETLQRWRTLCARATALDCRCVVATPGTLIGAAEPRAVRRAAAVTLRAMAEAALEHGIQAAFEFHGPRTSAVRTLAAAREVLESADHPAAGLVIDAFHFHTGGSTYEMLEGLDPQLVLLVRLEDADSRAPATLTDANRLLPCDGVLPLRDFVRKLREIGYDGLFSIALYGSAYREWGRRHLAHVARESVEALCAELDEREGLLDYA